MDRLRFQTGGGRPPGPPVRRLAGVTLAESLLAMVIVALAVLSISYVTTAGHQHMHHGEMSLRAVRLAEHLMEEIITRPYHGSGGSERHEYHLDDFDGFQEEPGSLTDFTGTPYSAADQKFTRRVSIDGAAITVDDLDDITIDGKLVTITVERAEGRQWQLTRFIPEPSNP